jgi:Raf kinase inhibitor-like YbhB/YbcL family protein
VALKQVVRARARRGDADGRRPGDADELGREPEGIMELTSEALRNGEMPVRYSKDGQNISPPLAWSDLPAGTRELALLFENVTPQTQAPFVQWLVYKISPEAGGLPEGYKHKADPKEPVDVRQGRNDLDNVGYDGPLGTLGRTIRYRFRLLALGAPLDLPPGEDKKAVLKAIEDHVLDQADLAVTYARRP